uniref:Ig-like domain-containing protein n=1 Tax=Scleropages formosus TaxID=113540 RepID=A0A8C9VBK4_SCLFO
MRTGRRTGLCITTERVMVCVFMITILYWCVCMSTGTQYCITCCTLCVLCVSVLNSAWTQIFTGETVTFRCEVQDGLTDWAYWWYKDDRVIPVYYSNTLTYSPVEVSHSGRYTCAGERNRNSNTLRSNTSSAVTLTVPSVRPTSRLCGHLSSSMAQMSVFEGSPLSLMDFLLCVCVSDMDTHSPVAERGVCVTPERVVLSVPDKPRPLLSITPQGTIYEGESVTLTCRLLPDSVGGATGSYTLRPAALTNTGTYVCGAVRGTPGYDTQYSDVHSLEVKGELLSFTGIRVSSGCCV